MAIRERIPLPDKTFFHLLHLSDNAVEAGLEPADSLVALDAVGRANGGLHAAAAGDALTRAGHAAVEVHAVDTDRGVVLDAEIDVLGDTEAEVASLGEVALAELVLLDLEATLENLLGLGATDGDVDGDLFVTTDTEGTDGVTSLAWIRGLEINSHCAAQNIGGQAYCRQESDQTAARAPWLHGSVCHQTRRRKCSERASES